MFLPSDGQPYPIGVGTRGKHPSPHFVEEGNSDVEPQSSTGVQHPQSLRDLCALRSCPSRIDKVSLGKVMGGKLRYSMTVPPRPGACLDVPIQVFA